MTLERAIELLTAFYKKGVKTEWVRNPIAWALYHTWRDVEEKEYEHQIKDQEDCVTTWKQISPARIYECAKCGQNVMTDDISAYKYCHGCGRRVIAK